MGRRPGSCDRPVHRYRCLDLGPLRRAHRWYLWDPMDYEPDGGNLHHHVFFRKSHEGVEDSSGSYMYTRVSEWVLSKFNGTSTPKGSYRAKTGDNDCNVNSSHHSLSTALCESIRHQAKPEQNVRQDPIHRVRHGEAALCTPHVHPIFSMWDHCQRLGVMKAITHRAVPDSWKF